jgi:cytochrome c556
MRGLPIRVAELSRGLSRVPCRIPERLYRRLRLVGLSLLFGLLLPGVLMVKPVRAQQGNVDQFMRAKLLHSQKVLEGLTTENFPLIAKHSQDLSLLSQAAAWQVLQTPEYKQHSTEFRRSADALTKAAEAKNLDGAALAYVDVTLKCISCHKYVRGVRMAGSERPSGFRLVAEPRGARPAAVEVRP